MIKIVFKSTALISGCFLILIYCIFFDSLIAQKTDGGEDDSKIQYELGFSYLLAGNKSKARLHLNKAMGMKGRYADLSRLQIIRLLAFEKRKAGEIRLPQIRRILSRVEDESLKIQSWYASIQSLYDYGEKDSALELALEMSHRFPNSKLADAATFFAAEIFFERKKYAAALDRLFWITGRDQKMNGAFLDDAFYLIARIFISPGYYYNPAAARNALLAFRKYRKYPAFKNSMWRSEALKMLIDLSRSK